MASIAVACSSTPVGKPSEPNPGINLGSLVAFPTHPEPAGGHDLALLQGKLVVTEGCLRLQPNYEPAGTYLIYWPYGYSYRDNAKGVEVFDEQGRFVANAGDYLSLAGGEYRGDVTKGLCEGPTWNAGSVDSAPGLAP